MKYKTYLFFCVSILMGHITSAQNYTVSGSIDYPIIEIVIISEEELIRPTIKIFDDYLKIDLPYPIKDTVINSNYIYTLKYKTNSPDNLSKYKVLIDINDTTYTLKISSPYKLFDMKHLYIVGLVVSLVGLLLLAYYLLTAKLKWGKLAIQERESILLHKDESPDIFPTGHKFGNATHVGQVREINEDYFGNFETPNGNLFLVCDGMGGHAGGAEAAQIVVQAVREYLNLPEIPDARIALQEAIMVANAAVLKHAAEYPDLEGMGATCVVVLIRGLNAYYAHVGDSRIYLFSRRQLKRLTKDHSFVQSLVDIGQITEQDAEHHPRKNEITKVLGMDKLKAPTVSVLPIAIRKGDCFLLCSDGLTGVVSDVRIERVLKKEQDVQEKANKLIEMANMAGGPDNITVQVICFN